MKIFFPSIEQRFTRSVQKAPASRPLSMKNAGRLLDRREIRISLGWGVFLPYGRSLSDWRDIQPL